MISLVTGATGHVGNTLIRKLIEMGEKVCALVLRGDDLTALEGLGVEIIYGDVTDYQSLVHAFAGVSVVYHLAGVISITMGKRRILRRVNVEGTKNVIAACRTCGVSRLIYASSVHAIAEPPKGVAVSEPTVFDPVLVHGPYAKSKAEATRAVLESGLDAVVVLPSGVIGPNEYKQSHLGQMVRDFVRRRLRAYIDGEYNFVDVRDVAQGLISAARMGRAGECYILSGERATVLEMMNVLQEATGIRAPRVKLPYFFAWLTAPLAEAYYKILRQPPLFTPQSIATLHSNCEISNQKAREELGYLPRSIRQSLFDSVRWMLEKKKIQNIV